MSSTSARTTMRLLSPLSRGQWARPAVANDVSALCLDQQTSAAGGYTSRGCRRTVRVRNEIREDFGMPELPFPLEVTTITLSGLNLTFVAVVGVIAVLALVMAMVFRREVLAANDGTTNMQTIARAVQEGASAYLGRQFRTLAVFAVAAFFLLVLLPVHSSEEYGVWTLKISRSIAFLAGAVFSGLIGYLGMWLAVRANVRVASAARDGASGRDPAMRIAFRTGA